MSSRQRKLNGMAGRQPTSVSIPTPDINLTLSPGAADAVAEEGVYAPDQQAVLLRSECSSCSRTRHMITAGS